MVPLIEQLCSRDVGKLMVTWRPLEMCTASRAPTHPPLVIEWLITLPHHILQARFLPTRSRHFSSQRQSNEIVQVEDRGWLSWTRAARPPKGNLGCLIGYLVETQSFQERYRPDS